MAYCQRVSYLLRATVWTKRKDLALVVGLVFRVDFRQQPRPNGKFDPGNVRVTALLNLPQKYDDK